MDGAAESGERIPEFSITNLDDTGSLFIHSGGRLFFRRCWTQSTDILGPSRPR